MDVIPFRRWRFFSFLDEHDQSVIRQWLDAEGIPPNDRNTLQLWITLIERGGPEVVPGCIIKIGNFSALHLKRKGQQPINLIFCSEVFGEREMTLLTCAHGKRRLNPPDALDVARKRLDILNRAGSSKRRYERID